MIAHQPDLLFHLHRSRCIDAFAKAEAAIAAFLARHGTSKENEALGQSVKKLREVPASPSFSKARRTDLHGALDQLAPLLPARNDLAHAELRLLRGSAALAVFTNPREQDGIGQQARMFSLDELEAFAKTARDVAVRLESVLQPARAMPATTVDA